LIRPTCQFDITVFCEEPRIAYDRVHLSPTSPTIPPKNSLWYVKVSTRNMALRCWSANARSPSTARRK
jgi:hypothetical protein